MSETKQLIEDLVHRSMAFELAVIKGLMTREQVYELIKEVGELVKEEGIAQAWNTIAAIGKK